MKILIICEYDNGGQMIALKKAFDSYTSHTSRLITCNNSYLNYECDIFDPTYESITEMCNWADFFILGETLNTDHARIVYPYLNPNNSIIRAAGTIARYVPQIYISGILSRIMKTGAYHDQTIASKIYPIAHTVNMYHFCEWPEKQQNNTDRVKICFSGTAQKQLPEHSGTFFKIINTLSNDDDYKNKIEIVNIVEKSWKESLEIKAGCDICFDQLSIGAYASSAIEGMFYRMPTFCYISNWCRSVHPNVPVISSNNYDTILSYVKIFVDKKYEMKTYGDLGHEYVLKNHAAHIAILRWTALIDYVREEYKISNQTNPNKIKKT